MLDTATVPQTAEDLSIAERIDIALLTVDHRVQRPIDESRAADIARELDLTAVGTLVVSARDNGQFILLDGQHRVAGLRMAGHKHYHARCDVRRGLTLAEEAHLFRRLNRTRRPTQVIDHHRGVVEGDPEAVGINEILTRFGWELGQGRRRKGVVLAVDALRQIWRMPGGPDLLNATIWTLTKAFGDSPDAVRREMLLGTAGFWRGYTGFSGKTLVARLSAVGLKTVRDDADGRKLLNVRLEEAVTETIVQAYNGRRRKKGLAVPVGSV